MESEFIAWLRGRLPEHPRLELGIGDDAAVVRLAESRCVVSVDVLTDGVDFHLAEVDPRRVGRKALAVNLSDMAAMAARPVAAVVGAVLPRNAESLARALCEGMLPLAAEFDVAIAGGDTNTWDGPLVLSVTMLGEPTARGVLRRRGALPGDVIIATGRFGGSILGHNFDFCPRVREALLLHERYELHAGIDVSDGLSLDVARVAAESACGAQFDLASIPVADDAHRLARERADGTTALTHTLIDGEDFELVLAVPPDEALRMLADQPLDVPLTAIGRFVVEPGLWAIDQSGARQPLPPRGYEH